MIAKAMRAILLASATATSLKGLVCREKCAIRPDQIGLHFFRLDGAAMLSGSAGVCACAGADGTAGGLLSIWAWDSAGSVFSSTGGKSRVRSVPLTGAIGDGSGGLLRTADSWVGASAPFAVSPCSLAAP
jgi:hypothetical protein